jgi:hypothetical protein
MKMAFVLSLITAGITFIFGLVNLWNEGAGYYFFDVVLFAIFAYWIYKKSLVATICAFWYFIMWKISQLVAWESVWAISVRWILFAIGYFKWMQWAISYRKLMNINNFNPREIVLWILTAIVFILVFVWLASGV